VRSLHYWVGEFSASDSSQVSSFSTKRLVHDARGVTKLPSDLVLDSPHMGRARSAPTPFHNPRGNRPTKKRPLEDLEGNLRGQLQTLTSC
jgi:hypothetical protein